MYTYKLVEENVRIKQVIRKKCIFSPDVDDVTLLTLTLTLTLTLALSLALLALTVALMLSLALVDI